MDEETKPEGTAASNDSNVSGGGGSKKPAPKLVSIIIGVVVILFLMSCIGQGSNKGGQNSSATSASSTASAKSSSAASTTAATTAKPVDKSTLESSIAQWSGITAEGYTEDTFQAFSDALAKAQAADADPNSTQGQVDSANRALVSAHSALKEAFNPDSYQEAAYKDVARNPDSYTGQKLVFTGRVLQVIEGTSETDLRIATDGSYDDVVFVGYDPSILNGTRVLEDDSVTVYGTCIGQYSYTSTLGGKISLPGLYADNVVIN